MPNLGPGVDQHVNVSPAPTWIFTPNPSGPTNVRLYNEGFGTIYVGQQGVNQYNGMPVLPNSKPIELYGVTQTLYAASPVTPTTAAATISATASTAGSGSFTVVTTNANLPAGTALIMGSPAGSSTAFEVLVVASTTSTTVVTFTTKTLYDHFVSSIATAATYAPGLLRVTAGVL